MNIRGELRYRGAHIHHRSGACMRAAITLLVIGPVAILLFLIELPFKRKRLHG